MTNEGYATASQSTKKGVRRIAFQDTDCNAVGEDDCKNLKSVTMKSTGLSKIDTKAFYQCKKLKQIIIQSKKLRKVGAKAFAGTGKKITIKVPSGKAGAYKKLFKNTGLANLKSVK